MKIIDSVKWVRFYRRISFRDNWSHDPDMQGTPRDFEAIGIDCGSYNFSYQASRGKRKKVLRVGGKF